MEAVSVVPEPESAAVRYRSERIDAWIRNRLIAHPLASCFLCRKPIIPGQDWQEVSDGIQTRGRVFSGLVTLNGAVSGKLRRDRRWGSRAEAFRSERSRLIPGADVARVARTTRHRRELLRHPLDWVLIDCDACP